MFDFRTQQNGYFGEKTTEKTRKITTTKTEMNEHKSVKWCIYRYSIHIHTHALAHPKENKKYHLDPVIKERKWLSIELLVI